MGELREKSMSVQGKVILDHTIPRMEYQGLRINAGQIVRVIDIEGEQVMDTVTLNASDPSEHSSMPWSNFLNKTWRLKKGHIIYSIRCNPMFKIIEDTVGLNYSGGGFCTAESNFTRYGVPHTWHLRDPRTQVEGRRLHGSRGADGCDIGAVSLSAGAESLQQFPRQAHARYRLRARSDRAHQLNHSLKC
jgi:hypothetical protein